MSGKIHELLDPNNILKYGTDKNAIDDFERFVQSYIDIHDNYDFSMIKRLEESPFKVGFLEDIYHFYALTEAGLISYETNQETALVSETNRFQMSSPIQCVSQNPKNKYLFAIVAKGKLTIYNMYSKVTSDIELDQYIMQVSWTCSGESLIYLNRDLTVGVVDLQKEKVYSSMKCMNTESESHFLVSHLTQNMALVCDDVLRLIDFREPARIKEFPLKKSTTAISWMPNENYGCAIGYADGVIDFFSFENDTVVMSQNLTSRPVNGIEFCPDNPSTVSIVVDNNIIFASLPSWGFGSLGKEGTYKAHLAPILDAHWTSDDISSSMISCDSDHMIHIFDVPEIYTPIYEP